MKFEIIVLKLLGEGGAKETRPNTKTKPFLLYILKELSSTDSNLKHFTVKLTPTSYDYYSALYPEMAIIQVGGGKTRHREGEDRVQNSIISMGHLVNTIN